MLNSCLLPRVHLLPGKFWIVCNTRRFGEVENEGVNLIIVLGGGPSLP